MNIQEALCPVAKLKAKLPRPLHSLAELAYNFWWSWSPERLSIFRTIDAEKWEQFHHNPVKLLEKVSYERLVQLAVDPHYLQRVKTLTTQFEQYIQQKDTWASQTAPEIGVEQPVAYFSIEYGLHQSLPLYAGGLGILAADHLKSASDLGLPLVGVGLLYRQGYFHQRFTSQGWQREDYVDYQFEELPTELLRDAQGEPLVVEIDIRQRQVKAQIWQVRVGRINLYLLDTDREDNEPIDCWITGQLYGGKQDTRIAQEMLLGIGGVKALQILGINPKVYHLNEGHAAFALLEVARQEIERTGQSFETVKAAVKDRCVFTTHTPVPAGHDTFSSDQITQSFCHYWSHLGLSRQEFLKLGSRRTGDPWEPFNMTVLALRLTRSTNGVSELNGKVCRQMWSSLYPDRSVEEVPIGHITNGVHARTYTALLISELYDKYLHPDWAARVTDVQMWAKVDEIPDQEIWWRHQLLKENLIAYARYRIQQVRQHRGEDAQLVQAAEHLLDPEALTIGFARRFSTYKRADLIIRDAERARQIFSNCDRPVQIIFAGKAHPADDEGKRLMQRIIKWSHHSDLWQRVVFIEDYDIHVATKLVQGVDLWLNLPRRTREASGTSGQKVCFNGGINCSVLDGWWCEGYQKGTDGKGINGWATGADYCHDDQADDQDAEDNYDSESLYRLLEEEIIPLYYDRDPEGLPRRWIEMMKASMKTVCPYFNTDRMLTDYITQVYLPGTKAESQPIKVAATA